MSEWTTTRVERMAPDPAALAAGVALARSSKWHTLGRSDDLVWGECQGSGATPYQVRVSLVDGAYKCSCPSRKQPCKHTIGLLLLLTRTSDVPVASPPPFVLEWTARRVTPDVAKPARAARNKPVDAEAQAQRVRQRESRIDDGLALLESWIADLLGQGLAAARAQPSSFWEQMAARLVDAQASGLARRIRTLGEIAASRHDWQSRLLIALSRLQLMIEAYRRRDEIPQPLAAEIRTQIGWPQNQDVLLSRQGIRDRWQVLGVRRIGDEQLTTQYVWLTSLAAVRPALLLEFAVGNQPMDTSYEPGTVVDAEIVYFDGAPALRALVKSREPSIEQVGVLPGAMSIVTLESRLGALLAENPLLERWPAVLGPATAGVTEGRCVLTDAEGARIATIRSFRHGWHLASLTRFAPANIFGEWTAGGFDPVSVSAGGRLFEFQVQGLQPVMAGVA